MRHDAVLHVRQVADPHDPARSGLDDGVAHLGDLPHRVIQRHEQQLVVVLHAPDHGEHVGLAERCRDVRKRQSVHRQTVRVHEDLDLALLAALHADIRDARECAQERHDLVFGNGAQSHGAHGLGQHRIGDDGVNGRVHSPHLVAGTLRQRGQHLRHGRIDTQGGRDHIVAPTEVDRKLRRAAARRRAQVHDPQHAADRAFEGDGHQQFGLVSGARAGAHLHHHAGELHDREQAIGNLYRGKHAGRGDCQQDAQDGADVARHEARRVLRLAAHGVVVPLEAALAEPAGVPRTVIPSCN